MACDALGSRVPEAVYLDMGCGTGLVGERLKQRGAVHVMGIDASSAMLEKSKEKEAYTELREMFLAKPESFPEELKNRFDAVTGAGILAEGHCTSEVLDEMVLCLK